MHVVEDTIDMDDVFIFENDIGWCYRDEYHASMGPFIDIYYFGTSDWFDFQDGLISHKTYTDGF